MLKISQVPASWGLQHLHNVARGIVPPHNRIAARRPHLWCGSEAAVHERVVVFVTVLFLQGLLQGMEKGFFGNLEPLQFFRSLLAATHDAHASSQAGRRRGCTGQRHD